MKTFTTIILLGAVFLVKSTLSAADALGESPNPLKLVLIDDHAGSNTATNISVKIIYQNIGTTNLYAPGLVYGLSAVWDGKEYKRDPKWIVVFTGVSEFQPGANWQDSLSLSGFLIPAAALTSGKHTLAVRDASAESNTLIVSITTQK
jgi:hypothetical protein